MFVQASREGIEMLFQLFIKRVWMGINAHIGMEALWIFVAYVLFFSGIFISCRKIEMKKIFLIPIAAIIIHFVFLYGICPAVLRILLDTYAEDTPDGLPRIIDYFVMIGIHVVAMLFEMNMSVLTVRRALEGYENIKFSDFYVRLTGFFRLIIVIAPLAAVYYDIRWMKLAFFYYGQIVDSIYNYESLFTEFDMYKIEIGPFTIISRILYTIPVLITMAGILISVMKEKYSLKTNKNDKKKRKHYTKDKFLRGEI